MGRIVKLPQSESGAIREAHIKLPNGRIIRRPVNLLIPLELGHAEPNETPNAANVSKSTQSLDVKNETDREGSSEQRYHLRPRSRTGIVHSLQSSASNDQQHLNQDNVDHELHLPSYDLQQFLSYDNDILIAILEVYPPNIT
ncbi:unnamed protein product [Angiostrongylus costaricensis]|uniref:DUF5641 domain-containing protein n=1 Tax=Angiostrongylus costaricensis TaxID=334426 RepID=A0A0R3PJK8_ANGCS|nr:unnamed protein product [Angiostrongylus costaricensis]